MADSIFIPSYQRAIALRDEVQITRIRLGELNHKTAIQFDISWPDSWRLPTGFSSGNWDAVWVFIKLCAPNRMASFPDYRPGAWGPAHFSTGAADTVGPQNAVILPSEDGLGFFVHRREPGMGRAIFRDVEVAFADNTAAFIAEAEELEVTIMGIRMVYIPAGPFWIGDPVGSGGPMNCFYSPQRADENNQCFQITSEDPIEVAPEGQLYYRTQGYGGDQKGPIPAAYPKGHQAFYVMREHVTQHHYSRFINLLPSSAKTIRYPYLGEGAFRFAIYTDRSGNRSATRGRRPCNYLAWADGAAFADWAALRPMSELELTKAGRGPAAPVHNEYAWGNTHIEPAQVILGNEATGIVVSGNCNIGNANSPFDGGDGGEGPIPSDSLLMRATPDAMFFFRDDRPNHDPTNPRVREESGASYYGVMGLSGNLWEYCVTVGNAVGRGFTGIHGNGDLNASGNPDFHKLRWPGDDGNGIAFRGGSWYTDQSLGRLADRTYGGGLPNYIFRSHDTGFRCARTAPRRNND